MWIFLYRFYSFVLKEKTLTEYTNLFSANNFKKNDDINLNYFLTILSGIISIASFASVIGAPAGIIGASCGLTFSITSGFVKKS